MNDALGNHIAESAAQMTARPFDITAIRERAARLDPVTRRHAKRSWFLIAAFVIAPCVVAAATVLPSPMVRQAIVDQIVAMGLAPSGTGKPAVTFTVQRAISVAIAVRSAKFHLTMPQGLPTGSSLRSITSDGTGTLFVATYAFPRGASVDFRLAKAGRGDHYIPWMIVGSSATKAQKVPTLIWIVGDEVVTVMKGALTAAQAYAIQRAMHAHDAPLCSPQRCRGLRE